MYFQDIGDSTLNRETDLQSKIELLETKLSEALEENKMHRAQEKRYLIILHSEPKCFPVRCHYKEQWCICATTFCFCYELVSLRFCLFGLLLQLLESKSGSPNKRHKIEKRW
jgi:hypothetical protein